MCVFDTFSSNFEGDKMICGDDLKCRWVVVTRVDEMMRVPSQTLPTEIPTTVYCLSADESGSIMIVLQHIA